MILHLMATANEPHGRQAHSANSLLMRPQFFRGKRSHLRNKFDHKMQRIEQHLLDRPVELAGAASLVSPLLVLSYKRADYLERTLWKIFSNHPANNGNQGPTEDKGRIVGCPIVVSQDGPNSEVQDVIETYQQLFEYKLGIPLYRIQHEREPNEMYEKDLFEPYKRLAKHYGWAIEQVFSSDAYTAGAKHSRSDLSDRTPPKPHRLIVLEEDIEVARDFFSLMNATADLLDLDDTLIAVSSYNDNGRSDLVADPKRLVRSDFFPGLGWMMNRAVWDGKVGHPGLKDGEGFAPGGFWDDWLREPGIRRGRQIIRPEISRTYHFGNVDGASEGEKNNMLNKIELEESHAKFENLPLTSQLEGRAFAAEYWSRVSHARKVETAGEAKYYVMASHVRLTYNSMEIFRQLASQFDITEDEKAGVPRTAYEGIVEIRYGKGNYFVFLTPPYLDEACDKGGGSMPRHFGNKAWKDYTKETLMETLGVNDISFDERPGINW